MLQKILITAGGVLIAIALFAFFQFGQMVYQLIYTPEQIGILQFLIKHIPQSQELISGTISGNNFAIQLAEPFRLMACLITIVLCSSVLVGIFRVIMLAGVELIKLAVTLAPVESTPHR